MFRLLMPLNMFRRLLCLSSKRLSNSVIHTKLYVFLLVANEYYQL